MKMQICGIEASEGVSKTGKPYAIGQLFTLANLAPPRSGAPGLPEPIAKGMMGTTYRCDPVLVRKIAHLPLPVTCEVTIEGQMRFGEREEVVTDIAPIERVKAAA